MKILVTGASGLIGGNLVKKLLQEGHYVRAIGYTRLPQDGREKYCANLQNIPECDIATKDIDYVFHCAAITSGGLSWNTPLIHITPNIVMNARLLEASYHNKVKKFIWLSSTTGYPDTGEHPVEEDEMMDGDPHDTYYLVGWMKRYTEILCKTYSTKLSPHMTCIVLRPSNIYGPNDKFDIQRCHMLPAMINKICSGKSPLEIWGNGEDTRDLVYVDDMTRAMILAASKLNTYTTLNIASERNFTVNNIADMICSITKQTLEKKYLLDKPRTIPARYINAAKAKELLGWTPSISLEEGLQKTIEWYSNNYETA